MLPETWSFWAEWSAVGLGVAYVVLAARPSVWAWPFGILGSGISVALFVSTKLYSEAWLNVAYVILGVLGWVGWNGAVDDQPITRVSLKVHALGGLGCVAVGLLWGLMMHQTTDAALPYVDAQVLWFSLFATWLVTRKVLENWLYWVVIDAVSAVMYASKGLDVYAGLMAAYTVMAAVGFYRWRKQRLD